MYHYMKYKCHNKSPAQRWTIIVLSTFLWLMFFSYTFGREEQTTMVLDLATCNEMMGSGEISGEAISQSLEIVRKFHAKQR
ncbi:hypothetical protein PENTCL1PPCAC_29825, partial [Pristionchus entomophagus]